MHLGRNWPNTLSANTANRSINQVLSFGFAVNYTFDPLCAYIHINSTIVMSKTDVTEAAVVEHVIYGVPKMNHEAMLQICKQTDEMFRQHGILRYDVYQLSNTDVPMKGFSNIASVMSLNQDEEIWVDSLYYKDHQHRKGVITKLENDERMGVIIKQSADLMPSGAKIIIGEFHRLSV